MPMGRWAPKELEHQPTASPLPSCVHSPKGCQEKDQQHLSGRRMTGILCGDGCVVCGKCYNLMSTSTARTHRFCPSASAALSDPVAHNHLRVQASRAFKFQNIRQVAPGTWTHCPQSTPDTCCETRTAKYMKLSNSITFNMLSLAWYGNASSHNTHVEQVCAARVPTAKAYRGRSCTAD